MIGSDVLEFETNDARQCHLINITIPADEICDDLSDNRITVGLSLLSGLGNINVEPSTARVIITDNIEPQCGKFLSRIYFLYPT